MHGRRWRYDKERAPDPFALTQMCQQRNGLHRLSESHLVSKDAIETLLIEPNQPIEADFLVRLERAGKNGRCLGGHVNVCVLERSVVERAGQRRTLLLGQPFVFRRLARLLVK